MEAIASGRVKISRDAVGAARSRRAVSGLTLSRKSRLKDSSGLSGKPPVNAMANGGVPAGGFKNPCYGAGASLKSGRKGRPMF